MYACFITFFVRSSWLELEGLAFGADSGAGDELYLSCPNGSKWPISTRAPSPQWSKTGSGLS